MRSNITITNVLNESIAYKLKTTNPYNYVVKPIQGILNKGQNITIDITFTPTADNDVDKNKLLVIVAPCKLSASDNTYALNTFWQTLEVE